MYLQYFDTVGSFDL